MKLFTPEICWHQKEPVFSIDFCPETLKLASCGADFTVKIWLVKEQKDGDRNIGLEFLSNLDRHVKPVNVVRFSPNGELLASAGDDGTVILWKLSTNEKAMVAFGDDEVQIKETWVVHKMLRGHIEDIYDLSWSPESKHLLTGSVDNSAIVWDAVKGQLVKTLSEPKHYVQGVCWDPCGKYLATHSSDRSCRIYTTSNYRCIHNINKNIMSYMRDNEAVKCKQTRMFMDETMQSFFRRCTFSIDGSLLFLPAGLCDGEDRSLPTTYVFSRESFSRPIHHLPGTKKATLAVKCSPVAYELIGENKNPPLPKNENTCFSDLPYRMVFAVASLDLVTFYDTQHRYPIAQCSNMHYASLTDIAWSSDGRLLVISSTDGYCSFVKFEKSELGEPITYCPLQYQLAQAKLRSDAKAKKKEARKSEPEHNSPKSTTPTSEAKPIKPANPNQPTIEKLFITPVRKRKRINNKTQSKHESPAKLNDISPSTIQLTPAKKSSFDVNSSPTVANKQKAAKRVLVTTLETFKPENPVTPVTSPKIPTKTPKRITVTTLCTFNNDLDKSEIKECTSEPASCAAPPMGDEPDHSNLTNGAVKLDKCAQLALSSPTHTERVKLTNGTDTSSEKPLHKEKKQVEVICLD